MSVGEENKALEPEDVHLLAPHRSDGHILLAGEVKGLLHEFAFL